jgi:hypothetical protein
MAMVCPQCSTSHEQRLDCPVCSTRLVFCDPERVRPALFGGQRFHYPTWARIFVGLVLAQGLFYALRQLITAVLLAWQGEEGVQAIWSSPAGFFLVQGMQLLALLVGGILTGSAQQKGFALGAIMGVWNGVFSVLLHHGPALQLTAVALYGQPLVHALFGALGGWLGSLVFRPAALSAAVRSEVAPMPKRRRAAALHRSLFEGDVAWFRVAAGTLLAILGTLTAAALFDFLLDFSHGKLSTADDMQDRLVTWEIKALALLLGGALAGATTGNGLKQGLCVGLASSVLLIGIQMHSSPHWLQLILLTLASAFPLGLAGGWFGSQLFPPVCRIRRKRLRHAT